MTTIQQLMVGQVQITPALEWTTDIPSTDSSTAGDNQDFTVAAADTVNTSTAITYQWQISTNSGASWSNISGATSATLTRYNPFYYDDSGDQIRCQATGTNDEGSNTITSTVCTLTVARYWTNSAQQTASVSGFSGTGLKPSGESGDEMWSSWVSTFTGNVATIDEVSTNSFDAGGRGDGCSIDGVYQGWEMKLELRVNESSVSGQNPIVWYDNEQHSSSTGGDSGGYQSYSFNIENKSWDYDTRGNPKIGLFIMDNGTSCQGGAGDNIFAKQYSACNLTYKYKYRVYQYETRP